MKHLSAEEMDELLMGAAPDEAQEDHLASCAQCRAQVSLFEDAMGDFNAASLAWAESRPAVSLRAQAAARQRQAWWAPLGWALVAAAALAVGVPVWQHEHRGPATVATAAPTDSAAQIAADNRMMAQVDLALGAEQESPLSEYGLSDGAPGKRTRGGEAKVQ